ncbi:MAG TPA: TolC family protein, partial [Caulobacter sp.]|nr:TolC family protein [Caulobacter sp.]
MKRLTCGLALAPLALLGACAVRPDDHRRTVDIAGAWTNAATAPAASLRVDRSDWWTLLGDPVIDQLVSAGLGDNPTLAEAAARVDQARAAVSAQDAGRLPSLGA